MTMVDPNPYFPPIEPYNDGFLAVTELHSIYYEESGNPDGVPAVILHGGPGAAPSPKVRKLFDPQKYRIVLFHQRGCGRSTPAASLVDNTTWDLVGDIEALRQHLSVSRWLVFGGSWGSTLALAYAQSHPGAVTALVLRGIFLGRQWEIDWLYQNPHGTGALFPEEWEAFCGHIPVEEQSNIIAAYYRRLVSDDAAVRDAAALAWARWEASASHLLQDAETIGRFVDPSFAAAVARIECHYFTNGLFLGDDTHLLAGIDRIRSIPGVIVQGRYDALCPSATAWELHRAWPEARFHIVADAGHSMFEPGIAKALRLALDDLQPRV